MDQPTTDFDGAWKEALERYRAHFDPWTAHGQSARFEDTLRKSLKQKEDWLLMEKPLSLVANYIQNPRSALAFFRCRSKARLSASVLTYFLSVNFVCPSPPT